MLPAADFLLSAAGTAQTSLFQTLYLYQTAWGIKAFNAAHRGLEKCINW